MENEFTAGTGENVLPKWVVESRTTYHTSSRQTKLKRPNWDQQQHRSSNPRIRAGIHGAGKNREIAQVYDPVKKQIVYTAARETQKLKPVPTSILNLNEYRFWRAAEGKGRCRACFEAVEGTKPRMEHQRSKGCTRVLVEAYKLLLRDKICVVCDKDTSQTKWGIPLCSQMCMYRWQFEIGAGAYNVGLAVRLYQSLTGPQPSIDVIK